MKVLIFISDKLDYLVEQFCLIRVSVLVAIIFIQVVLRYGFRHALSWPEELASLLIVWLIFFGVSLVFKRKNHIAVDFMRGYLPPGYGRGLEFVTIIFSFILAVIFVIKGLQLVKITLTNYSPALGISYCFWYLSVFSGGIVVLVHLILQSCLLIKGRE